MIAFSMLDLFVAHMWNQSGLQRSLIEV